MPPALERVAWSCPGAPQSPFDASSIGIGGSGTTTSPPDELATRASSSSQARLSFGRRLPWKTKAIWNGRRGQAWCRSTAGWANQCRWTIWCRA